MPGQFVTRYVVVSVNMYDNALVGNVKHSVVNPFVRG